MKIMPKTKKLFAHILQELLESPNRVKTDKTIADTVLRVLELPCYNWAYPVYPDVLAATKAHLVGAAKKVHAKRTNSSL